MLPSEVEVVALVWARSLLITEASLELRAEEGRVVSLHPNEVLLAPVVSEKSYAQIEQNKYSFKVHKDAHKTQVRQAVEQLFDVKVVGVNIIKVQPKPKPARRLQGHAPGLEEGDRRAAQGRQHRVLRGYGLMSVSSLMPRALRGAATRRRGVQRPRSLRLRVLPASLLGLRFAAAGRDPFGR